MRGRATLQGMLVVMLFLSVLGCGGGGDGPPSQPQVSRLQDASGQPLRDTNGNGIPDLPLEARPTIVPSFTGFAPGQAVEIQVFRDGMPLLPEPILLTASPSGDIPPTPVLWDIGVDANGQLVDATGRYSVVASGEGRQVSFSFEILSGRSAATSRQETSWFPHFSLLHGDPFRPVQGSVPVGDRINIGGSRFPPNERVRIYIVRDRDDWRNGIRLDDESGGFEEVTIDSYLGILPSTTIWNSAQRRGDGQTDGDYDVVVDVNRNGIYDQGVDVLQYRYGAAFTVQVPSPPGQHLAVELAASQYGVFKDEFSPGESVSVWVNPPWRTLTGHSMVRKYVVLHQDTWRDGDPLVDVTGRYERDLVRMACRNQYLTPVWYSARPGRYDVILDVDGNGAYTLGVDYIDAGITPTGQRVKEAGFIVPGSFTNLQLALDAEIPILNAGRQTALRARVITDQGALPNARVDFRLVGGRGGSLSAGSATTDSRGVAQVTLSASEPNTSLVVEATVTYEGRTAQARVSVRVRAFGELQATFE